jgi:hypothetical protein
MNRILAGGVHYLGVVVEGVKDIKKSLPSRPECTKTAKKQPVFHTY